MRPASPADVPTGMFDRIGHFLYDAVVFYGMTLLFGVLSVLWSLSAALLYFILPRRLGTRFGQAWVMHGFRAFLGCLERLGAAKLDLSAVDALNDTPGLVIVANHPSLVDVMLITSRLPRITGIMKAELDHNIFLSGGARLARYIRNDSPRVLVKRAVDEIKRGSQLLVFPEGTRTVRPPVNSFKGGFALIAREANVEVQTVFIDSSSPFLHKGWPIFKRPPLPLAYRLRLGKRLRVGDDVKAFTAELEQYFKSELSSTSRPPWPTADKIH